MRVWPFKQKALTGAPEVLGALRDGTWNPWPLLGGGSRQRIQHVFNTAQSANYGWLYRKSPAVRSVIDVIVRNVGQLDLRLYEEISEQERRPRPEHPAALSLRYPSEETPSDRFVRSLFKDFLIYDNAYALMVSSGNRVAFERLPVPMVEVQGDNLFRAENYRLWRTTGDPVDFDPAQILHWHGENPDDPRVGLSRLETLRDVIAEDAALQQAVVELANSGLTEPVWAYRPVEAPPMSPEAEAGLEEDLTNKMFRRHRRVTVTQEGTELRSFGVSPRDAQMHEIRETAIKRVAGEFGLPLGMVGLDDNLEEARSQFYADTLPPLCEDFTRFLNHRILVRVYGWTRGCFEFNLDEKHMGDDRLKALVSATGRPVMLTNEGRAKLNLPPVDGGDELVTPANVIVGDNPKPSVDVMPIQDPNKPLQDGSHRDDSKALAAPRNGQVTKGVEEFEPLPQLHPVRRAELERQHRHIDQCQAVVQRHYNRLGRSLKARTDSNKTDWARWDREFSDDLERVLKQIVEAEGGIYAMKLAGGDFDMRRVQHYLRAMAEGAAEGINLKIREEITEVGLAGALNRQAQHVESAGAGIGANATRWAREEAAKQAPLPERRVKTWIANTRRHGEWDGTTVGLGEDWPSGFAPGSARGCKCTQMVE